MHSNAVIIHTLTCLRFAQCPKYQERHVLSPSFVHGSHLCCKGCGENLLLQKLSMGELENFKVQKKCTTVVGYGGSRKVHVARHNKPFVMVDIPLEKLMCKITKADWDAAHAEFAKYCEADITNVRESLKLVEQTTVRRLVAKAAFKLGCISLAMEQRNQAHANSRKKAIKGELATNLKLCGIPYSEIELIIRDMVEALRNE